MSRHALMWLGIAILTGAALADAVRRDWWMGIFALAVLLLASLYVLAIVLRDDRRKKRIARAHQPRPLDTARVKLLRAREEGGVLREALVRGHGCCLVNDPEFDQALWTEAMLRQESAEREHDALIRVAETARWYARNGDRLQHEVDHALCVEVLSYAEIALEGAARTVVSQTPTAHRADNDDIPF